MPRPISTSRLLLALAQHQAAEVRRLGIDVRLGDLRPARGHALQPLHLLEQRRDVFEARLVDRVAQAEQLFVVIDERRAGAPHLAVLEMLLHACEDFFFLAHDVRLFAISISARGFGG